MLHKYKLNGLNIVLDVDTSTVMTVDDMTYELLEDFREKTKDEILESLKGKYEPSEILEGIDEIKTLVDQGLLFTELNYSEDAYGNEDLIKAVCLHVAHDCNLKCEYCFAAQGDFEGEKEMMTFEVGKAAIDFIVAQSKNRKNLEIDFFGGEPLMNLEVVKDLVDYAKETGEKNNKVFKFTMTTNGVLLDDPTMTYLNETMDNIVLSLDGRKGINDRMRKTINDQGSYDVIIEKIKKMAEMRGEKDHYVRGTYTHHNLDFSKDVTFLAKEGFKSISVEPVVAEKKHRYAITEEDLPRILEEYDHLALEYLKQDEEGLNYNFFHFNIDLDHGPCVYKRLSGCGAGKDYVAITPTGDVFPCHQFVGKDGFKMGNVFDGIQNAEVKEVFNAGNLLEKEACKKCWAKYFCGGGCHANAYNFNGSIMEPHNVSCEIERRRVENAIMLSILEEK
ncbi:MAG: thioether cross-link-forming SCIFF peptide maturase [Eubacteriaceae bacterium]